MSLLNLPISDIITFQFNCKLNIMNAVHQNSSILDYRSSHLQVLFNLLYLKYSQNEQENTCAGITFQKNCGTTGLQLYVKRDFSTGVSLRVLLNS